MKLEFLYSCYWNPISQLQGVTCQVPVWPSESAGSYYFNVQFICGILEHEYVYVIVRPLSTVGYTSVVASVIHSRQWSN